MRWSIPQLISPRGAGLGNEIFPWAKAYLASSALGLRLVDPPWRLNTRRYDRELDAGPWDTIGYLATRALPSAEVSRAMVIETGKLDYYEAMKALGPELRRQRVASVLHTSGMHGGYLGIRRARPFLRRSLLGAPAAVAATEQILELPGPRVRIGVHVRAGDFDEGRQVQPGVFNERLPLAWSIEVVNSLAEALESDVRVFLASDEPSQSLTEAFTVAGRPPEILCTTSVGDLAVLADCDLIVSSVSSFSMLAIFLSDAFYVWHKDQLSSQNGWLSIWGHEADAAGGGPTQMAITDQSPIRATVRRGIPQGQKPRWPRTVLRQLELRARARRWSDDLIYFGVSEAGSRH